MSRELRHAHTDPLGHVRSTLGQARAADVRAVLNIPGPLLPALAPHAPNMCMGPIAKHPRKALQHVGSLDMSRVAFLSGVRWTLVTIPNMQKSKSANPV